MADVQLEHGHTQIADDLLEALARAEIPGRQLRVMLALIRLIYGYRQKERRLGSAVIAKVAGMQPRRVRLVLAELDRAGLISRSESKPGQTASISIIKDFETWASHPGTEVGRVHGGPATRGTGEPGTRGTDRSATRGTASIENFKENFKENIPPVADAPDFHLSEPRAKGPKTPTPTERAKAVWPRLVAAAKRHGKDWRADPSKPRIAILAARIRDDGLSEEELEQIIDGAMIYWPSKPSEGFDPQKSLTVETLYRPSNWPKYLEAAENPPAADPNQPLTLEQFKARIAARGGMT